MAKLPVNQKDVRVKGGKPRATPSKKNKAATSNAALQQEYVSAAQSPTSVSSFPSRNELRAFVIALNAAGTPLSNGEELRADGLTYEWRNGATNISDMTNVVPLGEPHVLHFGDLSYGLAAGGNENSRIFAEAYAWVQSSNMKVLHYPYNVTIYLADHNGDGFCYLLNASHTKHIGWQTVLKNTDPTAAALARVGPATMSGSGNGRMWTTGNRFEGLIFDQGLEVQLCKNPGGENGTSTGWAGVGGGVVESVVDTNSMRCIQIRPTAAGGGGYYAIPTTPTKTYWVSFQIVGSGANNLYACASRTVGLSGALTPLLNTTTSGDDLGRVSFEFTATSTTSYLLFRANSGWIDGALNLKHVYCFEQRFENDIPNAALSASGMQYTTFYGCEFRNSGHYLIGLQNGGHVGNNFDDCVFSDNYMDAIDCKNNGSIQRANSMTNCQFYRNTLKQAEGGSQSAVLDLSEGFQLNNLYFEQIGCQTGLSAVLRFKTGAPGDVVGRGEGGRRNNASNIRIEIVGVPVTDLIGYTTQNRLDNMTNLVIRGTDIGISAYGEATHVSNAHILNVNTGIELRRRGAGSGSADTAERSCFSGVFVSSREKGAIMDARSATFLGVDIVSSEVGVETIAGTLDMTGGSITAPTIRLNNGGVFNTRGVFGVA